jgi:hypothetical protein
MPLSVTEANWNQALIVNVKPEAITEAQTKAQTEAKTEAKTEVHAYPSPEYTLPVLG